MEYEVVITPFIDKHIVLYSINPVITIAFNMGTKNINIELSKPLKQDYIKNKESSVKESNIKECNINDACDYIDCDKNLIGMICSCYIRDNLNLF